MSYRIHEKPKPLARRSVESLSTPFRVWMVNGTMADIAIPCFYQEVRPPVPAVHHNINWHHHVGWPSPHHPDHICQMNYVPHECKHKGPCKSCRHYIDARSIFPIHFNEEYGEAHEFVVTFTLDGAPLENGATWSSSEPDWNGCYPGIGAVAWADEAEDWVVRVKFLANLDYAIDEPLNIRFTVYHIGYDDSEKLDSQKVLGIGTVTILPSNYETYTDTTVTGGIND